MVTTWGNKGPLITLSNGNLTATEVFQRVFNGVLSSNNIPTGKRYWEYTVITLGNNHMIGVADSTLTTPYDQNFSTGVQLYNQYGTSYPSDTTSGTGFAIGDVIGMAFDTNAKTITFYKNNVIQFTASTATFTGYVYAITMFYTGGSGTVNFGATAFNYAPPQGFIGFDTPRLSTPPQAIGCF